MDHEDFEQHLAQLWNSVGLERTSRFDLFTFGESTLPYYLVLEPDQRGDLVSLTQGTIRITRPAIITPNNAAPEFRNFFEAGEGEQFVRFLLSRTAALSHLKFDNTAGTAQLVSDSVEEIVARLNRKLDSDEEEGTAILTAPAPLGWLALLRYAAERVTQSAPSNIQELRERGFLDF